MRSALTFLFLVMSLPLMAQDDPLTPPVFREMITRAVKSLGVAPQPVAIIRDTAIKSNGQQIGIRIYKPGLTGSYPIVYFIHGAAWVAGDLDTHDNICRCLTNALHAVVVAVDYHRPPEYKFPVPFNDAYAIFKWIGDNGKLLDSNGKLIVTGDSAGGGFAAAVVLLNASEKKPVPVLAQVLIDPALNLAEGSPAYNAYGMFVDWYVNPGDNKKDPRISPLLADNIKHAPPAIIVVGEKDKIRADGEQFSTRLKNAGIVNALFVQPDTGHLGTHLCAADPVAQPAIDFVVNQLLNNYLK